MSEVVYNILSALAVVGVASGVCYICADGTMASTLYENFQKSIEHFKRTGDRSILERQEDLVSKVDPHNIGILTCRTKKDILKELEELSKK